VGLDIHQKVELRVHFFDDGKPTHDESFASAEGSHAGRRRFHAGFGRDISAVDVFGERATNGFGENGGSRRCGLHR
jgi:hypothetical protein